MPRKREGKDFRKQVAICYRDSLNLKKELTT
jgi:hypothetical protein